MNTLKTDSEPTCRTVKFGQSSSHSYKPGAWRNAILYKIPNRYWNYLISEVNSGFFGHFGEIRENPVTKYDAFHWKLAFVDTCFGDFSAEYTRKTLFARDYKWRAWEREMTSDCVSLTPNAWDLIGLDVVKTEVAVHPSYYPFWKFPETGSRWPQPASQFPCSYTYRKSRQEDE